MNNPTFIDYFSLIILIVLALAVFLVRIIIPDLGNSPLVNTLFSFFEITFSLFIGFLLQRIDSEKRFYKDLRKYGLSAYRRISDISKSLERAKSEISRRRRGIPENRVGELDIINAIIEGTDETVQSSITDWIDIIGEDLKTKEKLQVLENAARTRLSTARIVSPLQLRISHFGFSHTLTPRIKLEKHNQFTNTE